MLKPYLQKLECKKQEYINQYRVTARDMTKMDYIVASLNSKKNNFYNILASDETRVKGNHFAFYINANYILDNYIATQQPNPNTYCDFWEMVYEKKCSLIVNLSGNNTYLPSNDEEKVYGNYKVRVENITDKNLIKIRNIHISKVDELDTKFVVYHATFSLWPDFDVPSEQNFIKLFDAINMIDYMSSRGPIVVHCRAGVGRTGTFIMVHYMLKKINEEQFLDPIDVLIEMRKARCNMIQESCQFEFALNLICNKIKIKTNLLSNVSTNKLLVPRQNSRNKLTSSCNEEDKFCKIKEKSDKKLSSLTEVLI